MNLILRNEIDRIHEGISDGDTVLINSYIPYKLVEKEDREKENSYPSTIYKNFRGSIGTGGNRFDHRLKCSARF